MFLHVPNGWNCLIVCPFVSSSARSHVKSLSHLKPVIRAPNGIKGKTRKQDGKNADHLLIEVMILLFLWSDSLLQLLFVPVYTLPKIRPHAISVSSVWCLIGQLVLVANKMNQGSILGISNRCNCLYCSIKFTAFAKTILYRAGAWASDFL